MPTNEPESADAKTADPPPAPRASRDRRGDGRCRRRTRRLRRDRAGRPGRNERRRHERCRACRRSSSRSTARVTVVLHAGGGRDGRRDRRTPHPRRRRPTPARARPACPPTSTTSSRRSRPSRPRPTSTPPFAKPVRRATGPADQAREGRSWSTPNELPRYGFQGSATPQDVLPEGPRDARQVHDARSTATASSSSTRRRQDAAARGYWRTARSPASQKSKDFFKMVLEDIYEGMFSDPVYGGNRDSPAGSSSATPARSAPTPPYELTQRPAAQARPGAPRHAADEPRRPAGPRDPAARRHTPRRRCASDGRQAQAGRRRHDRRRLDRGHARREALPARHDDGLARAGRGPLDLPALRARPRQPSLLGPLRDDGRPASARRGRGGRTRNRRRCRCGSTAPSTRAWASAARRCTGRPSSGATSSTDFRYRSHVDRALRRAARSPTGCTVQDWGITYDELEPLLRRVRMGHRRLRAGRATSTARSIPGGNPFEAPRSRGYPNPPLDGDAARREVRSRVPRASASIPSRNRPGSPRAPGPTRTATTAAAASTAASARGSAARSTRRRARSTPTSRSRSQPATTRCGRTPRCSGSRPDTNGLATGVTYVDAHGDEHFQPADVVVVVGVHAREQPPAAALDAARRTRTESATTAAASARTTPTRSTRRRSPASGRARSSTMYMGNTCTIKIIYDYNADNFDHSDLDFIGGSQLYSEGVRARARQLGRKD